MSNRSNASLSKGVPDERKLAELRRLERKIERGRIELNRLGESFRGVSDELLEMSQKVDLLIAEHARVTQAIRKQK